MPSHHPAKSANSFERNSIRVGDNQLRGVYVIRCSACPETETILISKFSGSMPFNLIQRSFHHKGWVIGTTRKHDVCPACLKRVTTDRQSRNSEHREQKSRATVANDLALANTPQPAPTITAPAILHDHRDIAMLLDRSAELHRRHAFVSSVIIDGIDHLAKVEADLALLDKNIATAMAVRQMAQPEYEDDKYMAFKKLAVGARGRPILGDAVRISHHYPGTRIVISRPVMERLGWTKGRVDLAIGEKEDAGTLRIVQVEGGDLSIMVNPYGHGELLTRAIRPEDPKADVEIQDTEYVIDMDDKAVLLSLPSTFGDRPTVQH